VWFTIAVGIAGGAVRIKTAAPIVCRRVLTPAPVSLNPTLAARRETTALLLWSHDAATEEFVEAQGSA
jgi:hypothetical protein